MSSARSFDTSPGARVRLSAASMQHAARIDAAEAAVRRHDYVAAAKVLYRAPSLLQGTGDGRVLELMALCAANSPAGSHQDPKPLWTRALWAYQEVHDMGGMERTHRSLGSMAQARGDLTEAARELRYAQRLIERQHRPDATVLGLCQQAEVAMAQGSGVHQAVDWGYEAVALAQATQSDGGSSAGTQAHARLLRAQALCLTGDAIEAARDLLWAQRLAAQVPARCAQALELARLRARCLLLLGHPHRAGTCLAQAEGAAADSASPDAVAHHRLLLCEAWVGDQPHRAHDVGLAAHRHFAARRQTYNRAACEIALVRTSMRMGGQECRGRLAALASLPLTRWPLLQHACAQATAEVEAPYHHPLGAVQTPWMHAMGQIHTADLTPAKAQAAPDAPAPGLMARIQHVWGRVTGEDDNPAPRA